jgi:hypothetical protein
MLAVARMPIVVGIAVNKLIYPDGGAVILYANGTLGTRLSTN